MPPTEKPTKKSPDAWRRLAQRAKANADVPLRDLFDVDDKRFRRFSLELDGLLLDFSKQRVDRKTMDALFDLAREADVDAWRKKMFTGAQINDSERRAAFHVALRNRATKAMRVGGEDVMPAVRKVLAKMRSFSGAVRSGVWRGATGKRISTVVAIGIGGSHLGPAMACDALMPWRKGGPAVRFVSSVDGTDLARATEGLDPATTLFVVVSKTFTTQETMANAKSARAWLTKALGKAATAKHFVAVSTNAKAVAAFGIDVANMFPFWDWVGGRFSIWSSVGLPVALACGMAAFEKMLAGGHAMDEHFRTAPLEENLPVTMALLDVWNVDCLGAEILAVLPYDRHLDKFPAFLQQLMMESNGKGVGRDGRRARHPTGPVVFGATGTDAQHSFFQLLHQGTQAIACDFIAVAEAQNPLDGHHDMLVANCLAQSAALMRGRTKEEARDEMKAQGATDSEIRRLLPLKVFPGNRPSTTILLRRLDPFALGQLIALYEHRVFVAGVLWGVNSFDQWGVELGKKIADSILPAVADGIAGDHDGSTAGLAARYRAWAGKSK